MCLDEKFYSTDTNKSLINELVQLRIRSHPGDVPMGFTQALIDRLSLQQLSGIPENIITVLVKTWMKLQETGMDDEEILLGIEKQRSRHLGSGTLPVPLNLASYIKYRLELEHKCMHPLTESYIDDAIWLIKDKAHFYNHSNPASGIEHSGS